MYKSLDDHNVFKYIVALSDSGNFGINVNNIFGRIDNNGMLQDVYVWISLNFKNISLLQVPIFKENQYFSKILDVWKSQGV